MKIKIETPKAPRPKALPYSQAIVANGLIFIAGHIATTPEGSFIDGPIEGQAHQVMKNLQAILEEAGATFADVVKTTIYLIDMADYGKMNEVYTTYVPPPYPARETVVVSELPLSARVEISMIASLEK